MREYLKTEDLRELTDDQLREELAELSSEVEGGVACGVEVSLVVQECKSRDIDLSEHEEAVGLAKNNSYISNRIGALPETVRLSEGYVGLRWSEADNFSACSRHMKCRDAAAEALNSVGVPAVVGDPDPEQLPLYDLALVLNSEWVTTDEDTADSKVPPKAAQEAAKRGLELRARFGRGGTAVGVARARDLANARPLSPQTVARMRSFFARHGAQVDRRDEGWGSSENPSAQYIAHLLWGGDPGRDWANRQKPSEKGYGRHLAKSEDEKQIIYYIVSEPDTVDAHGHRIDSDTIENALHEYMRRPVREVRWEHDKLITGRAEIVEGFVAPCDISEFHGVELDDPIKRGSSIVGMHFSDKSLWNQVKDLSGGISFGGYAKENTVADD